MVNAYDVLGIPPSAGKDEILQAYRRQVLLHHPDRNPEKGTSNRIYQLNEARDTLLNPILREIHDLALGLQIPQPPMSHGGPQLPHVQFESESWTADQGISSPSFISAQSYRPVGMREGIRENRLLLSLMGLGLAAGLAGYAFRQPDAPLQPSPKATPANSPISQVGTSPASGKSLASQAPATLPKKKKPSRAKKKTVRRESKKKERRNQE